MDRRAGVGRGDERAALDLAAALPNEGFLVAAIRYPTVAKSPARLRMTVTAAHVEAQIRALCEALGLAFPKVVQKLTSLGVPFTSININAVIDTEMAELVAADHEVELEIRKPQDAEEQLPHAVGEAQPLVEQHHRTAVGQRADGDDEQGVETVEGTDAAAGPRQLLLDGDLFIRGQWR